MIPLLTRIEQDLAQCSDRQRAAELQAERASYLARIGDFSAANNILASLRQEYSDGRNVRISIWMMLVEGLISFYCELDLNSRDRLLRAYVLGEASQQRDLLALAAAWLAHVEFNQCQFESMGRYLTKGINYSDHQISAHKLRVYMVVADAYRYCGSSKESRFWYEKTRNAAVALGDEASLAAMIYNKAALAVCHLRVVRTQKLMDEAELRVVELEVASAYGFHVGSGQAALHQLMAETRARFMLLEERFSEALPLFKRLVLDTKLATDFMADRSLLRLDYARCLVAEGYLDVAREIFESVSQTRYSSMSLDDRIVFLWSYSQLAAILDCNIDSMAFQRLYDDAFIAYRAELTSLKSLLDSIVSTLK